MPRRPAKIERDIPLYLVPHFVKRGVSIYGDELEGMDVRRTGRHFYNISIRTKPIRKELRSAGARRGICSDAREPNLPASDSSGRDPEDTGPDDGSGGELE